MTVFITSTHLPGWPASQSHSHASPAAAGPQAANFHFIQDRLVNCIALPCLTSEPARFRESLPGADVAVALLPAGVVQAAPGLESVPLRELGEDTNISLQARTNIRCVHLEPRVARTGCPDSDSQQLMLTRQTIADTDLHRPLLPEYLRN